ncbi:MAG: hypothetical protein F6J89_33370 [Symploca sp. SIO1C4]|uniref:Uncharacterized protein n=1 Tax=Symploca sp. SIO1C4 TaxID=2607765 RepID=A0A6B3NLI3_9CYAN|nr:hypothetical protein [Symploca sp. SIO1C4]NET09412.1 hypothetical protein [Symploca sp. SIO2B6]
MFYSVNQGYFHLAWENDLEDFRPPYYIVGQLDRELLIEQYLDLRKVSYGVISRTGKEIKQWFDYG